MKALITQQQINEMRDLGRSLADKGFFEADLVSGHVTWANEYALKRWGWRLDQVQAMTAYDLVPEEFHDQLSASLANQAGGKHFRFSIWPTKDSQGRLAWWYIVRLRAEHPFYWYKGEFLNVTDRKGPEYSSMLAAMATTNSYNELYSKIVDVQEWTEHQVERLDGKDRQIEAALEDLGERIKGAMMAAKEAAAAANGVKGAFETFQQEVAGQLSRTTTEIVRLVTTDALHERRIAAFEEHVKATTEAACKAITVQANKEGRGLSKRVVIPVSLITALATIVQWLIEHWHHK